MKRFGAFSLVVLTCVAALALALTGQSAWLVIGVLALGAGLWASSTCFHPRPLSLLPPIRSADGTVAPAQWFCSACGRSWPAMIDHPHPPVPKFMGHDQSKAAAAAKRAAALELRTRELAVMRSGMKPPSSPPPAKRSGPVPVQSRRAG
jgi:hypothetical protein